MKKLILLALSITGVINAQVGIGTTNPLDMLHVAGETRIDGLNTSNPLNNGVLTKVYVDNNGRLVLGADAVESVIENQTDIIPFPIGLSNTDPETVLHTETFVIDYPRLVRISSSISLTYYRNWFYTPITNGMNRLTGSVLRLNGVEISEDRDDYTNNGSDFTIMTGYNYLKNYREILLPAGTYTIELSVFVANGGGSTYVEFGGNNVDVLSIIQD